MAKKILTHKIIGTTWQIHRDLIDSPGLEFVLDYLEGYDYSKLRRVRLNLSRRGTTPFEKAMPEDENADEEYYFQVCGAYYGHCGIVVVDKEKHLYLDEYEALCYVKKYAPYPVTSIRTARTKFGKRKVPFEIYDVDEAVVAIVAHEVGHYLADTAQIPRSGKKWTFTKPDGTTFVRQSYDEVEAGEFTKAAVEAYRRGDVMTKLDTPIATVGEAPSEVRICLRCGALLSSVARRKKFCSDECRSTWHTAKRAERTAGERSNNCVVCGVTFTPRRSDAKTCSNACRQRLKRERAWLNPAPSFAKVSRPKREKGEPLTTDEATAEALDLKAKIRQLDEKWKREESQDKLYEDLADYRIVDE